MFELELLLLELLFLLLLLELLFLERKLALLILELLPLKLDCKQLNVRVFFLRLRRLQLGDSAKVACARYIL